MFTVFRFEYFLVCIQQNYLFVNFIFQKKNNMTFVNKSPKQIATCIEDTLGPSSYNISSKSQTMPTSCLLSKTVREEHRKQNEDTLGAGSYNLSKVYNNQDTDQAVFKSKIQRFTNKEEKKVQNKYQIEKRYIELLNYREHQKTIPGKLVSLNQRRELQKKLMPQVLPSIPTNQSSYGYRYDQNCKRLIQNQNPKIIFANATSKSKQDFYFQRTQSYIGKGVYVSIQKKLKRPSPQLKYQLILPDPTKYQPDVKIDLNKIKNAKEKNIFISNKQRFQEQNTPIKEMLKIEKLKRQFKDYIPQEFPIKDTQKLNTKQSISQSQRYLKRGKTSQCFLSKIDRFNQKQAVEKEKLKIDQIKKVDKTVQKSKLKAKKEKKKQTYDLGQSRFKQKGKQNLGPGYYELKTNQQNAAFLNQKEKRFKTQNTKNDIPGPGFYQVQIAKTKQKVKVPFSRYMCNIQRENKRFTSFQSIYQQDGKQLNYECKPERQKIKKLKGSPKEYQKAHVISKKNMNRIKQLIKLQ